MSDPLALLPFAAAARDGRIDNIHADQLVAAGVMLLRRSAALVRALDGRRSAILLPTSPAFLTALAASDGRGAVLVNPLAAPLEIAHQLREANVGAVFTDSALATRLPHEIVTVLLDDAPRSARVIGSDTRDVDLGTHEGIPLEGADDVEGRDEEAAIVYTSAMFGTPRGAILTHRNLLGNARATVEAAALTRDDISLAVLPFAHLFGLVVSGVAPLLAGGRVLTMDRFHPVKALDLLERADITMLAAVPAVFHALVAVLEKRRTRLAGGTLRLCICGGAPLPQDLQDRWVELTGVELRQGYGLTEAGPVCLFNRVALPNRRGTLGVPFPGVEVSIRAPASYVEPDVGASTANPELPAGSEGEICVRGVNVFRGYVSGIGLPLRGGWLHTGDRGRMDPDGTVRFTGLYKPMFTRSGFNVYPREVGVALRELDGVLDARVHARPDPTRENDVVVQVVGAVTESAVRSWCERRLASYKQPAEVTIHDRRSSAAGQLD